MNQKLFYILFAIIGISTALPVGEEYSDINDLSADGYVPAENAELAEEDLSDRNKRQANELDFEHKGQAPLTFVHGAGGGNFHNPQNWNAHLGIAAGAKVWESANQRHSVGVHGNYGQAAGSYQGYRYQSPPQWGYGATYRFKF